MASEGTSVIVQGRIVWLAGDLFKGRVKTEFNSKTPKLNAQGEQQHEWGFGLAVPMQSFQACGVGQPGHIWTAMQEEALKIYPNSQYPPAFAWKFKNGDTDVDDKGVKFSAREGYAGHLVFALTTQWAPKFYRYENGQNMLVNEGIKCGDYVEVQVHVKGHPAIGQGKPGLYLNPLAVRLVGYGAEIINTPSGDQIFGTTAPVVPPGASAMPVAPAVSMPMANPNTNGAPQGGMPAPGSTVGPAIQPHHGVLPQAHQPPVHSNPPSYPQGNGYPAAPTVGPAMPGPGAPSMGFGNANPAFPSNGMPPLPGQR